MAKLVVDTNSLIQCISRRSRYHDLWLSFLDGSVLKRVDFPKIDIIGLDEIIQQIR